MKRRKFLLNSSAIALGLPILSCSNPASSPAIKHSKYVDNIGLQLWTVRDQLAADFKGTIASLAKAGYVQLEAMNMPQLDTLLPIAKDHGLKVESSFFQWTHLTGRWDVAEKAGIKKPENDKGFDGVLEAAHQKGIKHLICGYLLPEERSNDDYKHLAEAMNKAGEKCNAAGVTLNYHNHNFEFANQEGEVPYEILMTRMDPKLAKFELDVFWCSIAGYDPIELMNRMDGKLRLLHLKDKQAGTPVMFQTEEVPNEAFQEVGDGSIEMAAIIKLAEEKGVASCFVEQDQSPDPIQSVNSSITWLKNNA